MHSTRGIPLVGRLALGAGVLAVAVLVLYLGAGGLSVVAGALSSTLGNFVQGVTATPVPSEVVPTAPEAPTIESRTRTRARSISRSPCRPGSQAIPTTR